MLNTPPETALLQTSPLMRGLNNRAELFRHVSAEKSALYRIIMDSFASAKRQFRLHLRPNEVLAESQWSGPPPRLEEVQSALAQLAEWGNLESQPDMARFSTLSDYYRAHYLYRLSQGGEAVFERTLRHRAELQTMALEDIASGLQTLLALSLPDAAKVRTGWRKRKEKTGLSLACTTCTAQARRCCMRHGYNTDWIEKCLAHEQKGVRAVYNKTEYREQRTGMRQDWADMIDGWTIKPA